MSKSAVALAKKLLRRGGDRLEELRIYEFPDDESAHDDELTERLCADFSSEFERVQAELTNQYGSPSRTGKSDDESIRSVGSSASQYGMLETKAIRRGSARGSRRAHPFDAWHAMSSIQIYTAFMRHG